MKISGSIVHAYRRDLKTRTTIFHIYILNYCIWIYTRICWDRFDAVFSVHPSFAERVSMFSRAALHRELRARRRKQLESVRENRPTDLQNRKPFRYRSTAAYCFLIREERVQRSAPLTIAAKQMQRSSYRSRRSSFHVHVHICSLLFCAPLRSVRLAIHSVPSRPVAPGRPARRPRFAHALDTRLDSTRERTSPNASCLLLRSLNWHGPVEKNSASTQIFFVRIVIDSFFHNLLL